MKESTILKLSLGVIMIAVLAVGAFLVSAMHTTPSYSKVQTSVSEQQAVSIASTVASGNVADVEFNEGVYSVEFEQGSSETEVYVDAVTGEILKVSSVNREGI